jgi:hypothetical protein
MIHSMGSRHGVLTWHVCVCVPRRVVTNAHGLWHELCIARVGAAATRDVAPYAARLGWTRVVRELHTLEAVGWDSIKVRSRNTTPS